MVRGTKINLYIRVMEKLGISAKDLLADTNIDRDALSDPAYSISQTTYYTVIFNMLRLSNYSGVAFLVGREIEFGDLGVAGYAVMTSSTIGQGLSIRRNYNAAYFGTQINFESIKSLQPGYELVISSQSPTERLKQFEIEEFFSTGLHLIESLIGKRPEVERATFTYSRPVHYSEYEKLFNCPIHFDADTTSLKIRHPDLDTPIVTKNEELFEICTKHCQRIMVSSGENSELRERLCNLFLAMPGSLPELESAADYLQMSSRSLRRKLKDENTNYEALKSEFRLDLARQLMFEAKMKPKQIAYYLGYSSPSAFSRAFKTWTGTTIKNYFKDDKQ